MKREIEWVGYELLVLYNSLSFGREITAIGKAGCARGFKSSPPSPLFPVVQLLY